jgi:HEAT repeat protein
MTDKKKESRDADFNRLIRNLFHAEEWKERAEAARNLGYLQDGRAVNLMCKALRKEGEYMVVNRIIEALGRIQNPKATLLIVEKLKEEIDKKEPDKYRVTTIIESLMDIKDKRALPYIGYFLNSEDKELKKLAQDAFDLIEPEWKTILEKEKAKEKSIQDVFKTNL